MKAITINAEMAKAILEGRKVQFRMAIENEFKYNPDGEYKYSIRNKRLLWEEFKTLDELVENFSRYKKGDILYVREPAKVVYSRDNKFMKFKYLADNKLSKEIEIPKRFRKHNGIEGYNPKWIALNMGVPNGCIKEMARIFLKIIDIKVESLQECIGLSLLNEGWDGKLTYKYNRVPKEAEEWFIELWDKTAQKGYKWEDNPFVFVYDFEVLSENPNAEN